MSGILILSCTSILKEVLNSHVFTLFLNFTELFISLPPDV